MRRRYELTGEKSFRTAVRKTEIFVTAVGRFPEICRESVGAVCHRDVYRQSANIESISPSKYCIPPPFCPSRPSFLQLPRTKWRRGELFRNGGFYDSYEHTEIRRNIRRIGGKHDPSCNSFDPTTDHAIFAQSMRLTFCTKRSLHMILFYLFLYVILFHFLSLCFLSLMSLNYFFLIIN